MNGRMDNTKGTYSHTQVPMFEKNSIKCNILLSTPVASAKDPKDPCTLSRPSLKLLRPRVQA